jgi:hypothetical protein
LAVIGAAAGLCGCETVSDTATRLEAAGHRLEVQAMTGLTGAEPAPVRGLMERPLTEIGRYARFGSAWHRYEFARRLEHGTGVSRDLVCAIYWYERADQTVRPFGHVYAIEPLGVGETGIWHARAAVRRIKDAKTQNAKTEQLGDPAPAPSHGDAAARCAGLVMDAPAFAQPPTPVW